MNIDLEIWKDIPNYEGRYQVSNLGRVKSLNYGRTNTEKLLKPRPNGKNYLRVGFNNDGITYTFYIHRLVAKAFPEICGEWFEGCEIDHINTIKSDNRATNLKVCTRKENCNNPLTRKQLKETKSSKEYKDLMKRIQNAPEVKMKQSKRSKEMWENEEYRKIMCRPVSQYTLDGKWVKDWESCTEIEKETGFWKTHINYCCRGKILSSKGYIWKYKEDGQPTKEEINKVMTKNKKSVNQFTIDGEFVAKWSSIKEAERTLNITNVQNCCKGRCKSSGGYIWKYAV